MSLNRQLDTLRDKWIYYGEEQLNLCVRYWLVKKGYVKKHNQKVIEYYQCENNRSKKTIHKKLVALQKEFEECTFDMMGALNKLKETEHTLYNAILKM